MNKELRKAIYTRSRLRNKFCVTLLKETEALYKHENIITGPPDPFHTLFQAQLCRKKT